jgi:rubrerythrin
MSVTFNADEILALAERIEQHGAAFYRRAAEVVRDPTCREKLLQLAEWEGSHESLFASIRRELGATERQPVPPDPDDDTLLYLRAMGARHVLYLNPDVTTLLRGDETPVEVLELAIRFERDSIALFQGLEVFVPTKLGGERIQRLIREEMGHVAFLARERDRVAAG